MKLTRLQKEISIALASFIVVASLLFSFYQDSQDPASPLGGIGGPFELRGADGPVKLKDFRGKIVVLYFGFTFCPDICPTSLADLTRELKNLPQHMRQQIQPIFVSVDHLRDTPITAQEYAEHIYERFVGLTGSKEQLKKMTRDYGAYYKIVPLEDSAMGHTVDHSSRFYVINQKGQVIKTYTEVRNNEEFRQTLKNLAKEKGWL